MSRLRSKSLATALWSLVYEEERNVDAVSVHFMQFLKKNHLEHMAGSVLRHLARLQESEKAEKTLHIHVAHSLSDTLVRDIQKFLNVSDTAFLSVEEDADVLGGFRASYGELFCDASLRNELSMLRRTLLV